MTREWLRLVARQYGIWFMIGIVLSTAIYYPKEIIEAIKK